MGNSSVIIQVGLPWDYHIFDAKMQEFVKNGLEAGRKQMKEAGYDNYSTVDVSPELGIDQYAEYLKTHKVDGVCFGYGIRRSVELTSFLEQLVQTTRVHAPQSKILFNTSPDGALEPAKRWFP